jgi:hypothetical protein
LITPGGNCEWQGQGVGIGKLPRWTEHCGPNVKVENWPLSTVAFGINRRWRQILIGIVGGLTAFLAGCTKEMRVAGSPIAVFTKNY